jgi:hypothetical protein
MTHLLAAWRWQKLLGDDATENEQRLLAILLGKRFPEPMQA